MRGTRYSQGAYYFGWFYYFFFFQAEDGIRDHCVTGVQTCALPILLIASSGCFLMVLPNGPTWLYRWVPFQIEVAYITNQHQYQSIDFIVAIVIVLSCQQNCVDNPNHILQ